MGLNYMVFDNRSIVKGHQPSVGEVVSVTTFVGKGLIAEVAADRKDGYLLKYPSQDGLKVLYKTVPHWLYFERVEKTILQIAVALFRASGPPTAERISAFEAAWGDGALRALLTLSP